MKLNKLFYLLISSLGVLCFTSTPVIANEPPAVNSSSDIPTTTEATKPQVKTFDCHFVGAKKSGDLEAQITKDGNKFSWSDNAGASGPMTLLPNHSISLDYSYTSKDKDKVAGKMTFDVKEDDSLDGTFSDNFDSGKITCSEHKK